MAIIQCNSSDNTISISTNNITGYNLSWRNKLINGNFDFWQRGTSFTATGYTADRWRMLIGTGAAGTVSRQSFTLGQTDVPNEPKYFIRFNRTTTGSAVSTITQRIEDVRTLAGQQMTISFYAKASSSFSINVDLNQIFGSGGSSNVVTNIGSVNVTTSFQRFSLTGNLPSISSKTIGTSHYINLQIELPLAAGVASLDLSQVQVEKGPLATAFEIRPLSVELAMCQRYYAKTFPLETVPAQNAGGSGPPFATWGNSDNNVMWWFWVPQIMRTSPTVVTYNPFNTNSNFSNGAAEGAVEVINVFQQVIVAWHATTTNFTTAHAPQLHATADAEL